MNQRYNRRCKLFAFAIVMVTGLFMFDWSWYIFVVRVSSDDLLKAQEEYFIPGHMQTASVSEFLNKHSFLLSNHNICRNTKNLSLIILIHSAPIHFSYRIAIRKTWGNYTIFQQQVNFRIVFLFGKVNNQQLQEQLNNEHRIYGDCLQGDFVDGYRNLTLNTLSGLAWINEHCRNVKVVMKVDDDVVVDMYSVSQRVILRYISDNTHVYCKVNHKEAVDRNIKSKVFVKNTELVGLSVYPPYCEGKVVIFTSDLIDPILLIAKVTPLFWIEDVYVYGFVMMKIRNLKIDIFKWGKEMDIYCGKDAECVTSDKTCTKIFAELKQNIVSQIENVWKVFQIRRKNCPKFSSTSFK